MGKEEVKVATDQPAKKKGRLAPNKSLVTGPKRPEEELEKERLEIKKKQDEHPTRNWFDVFFCQFIKQEMYNRYTKKNETCLISVQLETKRPQLKKTFIEPRNIYGGQGLIGLNERVKACGDESGLLGKIYLAPGEFNPGDRIDDFEYLREIGVLDETVMTYEDFGYTKEQAFKKLFEPKK